MRSPLRQTLAITSMNFASLLGRWESSAVVVLGMAGVAFVFVALFALSNGLQAAIARTGAADRALILGAGSNSEINGSITRAQAEIIRNLPGIAAPTDARGSRVPLASGEIYATANLPRADRTGLAGLVLRGVSKDAFRVRPEVRVLAGRKPVPGRFEIFVGRGAAETFGALAIGSTVSIKGVQWRVVGHFAANGSATESEAWIDVEVMANVFRRGVFLQSVTARLVNENAIAALRAGIANDRRLANVVFRESAFYAEQAASSSLAIRSVGIIAGTIMAIGALFSALNIAYGSVSARTRELATLKALGFGSTAVVSSVLTESLLLSAIGGVGGAVVGALVFDGRRMSSLGGSFGEVAFSFAVTPMLIVGAIALTLLLGVFGGLLPALRAAHANVVQGLRAIA